MIVFFPRDSCIAQRRSRLVMPKHFLQLYQYRLIAGVCADRPVPERLTQRVCADMIRELQSLAHIVQNSVRLREVYWPVFAFPRLE